MKELVHPRGKGPHRGVAVAGLRELREHTFPTDEAGYLSSLAVFRTARPIGAAGW